MQRHPEQPRTNPEEARFFQIRRVADQARASLSQRDADSVEAGKQAAFYMIMTTPPIGFQFLVPDLSKRRRILEHAAHCVRFFTEKSFLTPLIEQLGRTAAFVALTQTQVEVALDDATINLSHQGLHIAFQEAPELVKQALASGKEAAILSLIVLLHGNLPPQLRPVEGEEGASDAATVVPGMFIRYRRGGDDGNLKRSIIVKPL